MNLIDIRKLLPDDFDPGRVCDRILDSNNIRELGDILERMKALYSATPAGKNMMYLVCSKRAFARALDMSLDNVPYS